jgi:hypothetical protein
MGDENENSADGDDKTLIACRRCLFIHSCIRDGGGCGDGGDDDDALLVVDAYKFNPPSFSPSFFML